MATINTTVKMDVDNPPAVLKRSSSAPMINELNKIMASQTTSHTVREPTTLNQVSSAVPRMRRFSASCSPLSGPSSPKLTPRVNQLRREESVDLLGREAAHERELNSAMVMSQSWEDLTLVTEPTKIDGEPLTKGKLLDPLHLSLPNSGCAPVAPFRSTPSPTRSTSVPLRLSPGVFKTNLSPSPTRKFATRRSQSPIAMRPSPLGNSVKRKFELEDNEPPAKRFGSMAIQQSSRCEPLVPNRTSDPLAGFDKLPAENCGHIAKPD
ncbi:P2R1A-PPP2R2A-interacting phosphatase regulator 1 [Rhodnius prolixus]|uniref:Protein FAM122A n=1 Tax=Rhodnius prolixus TaxID=13249 RepID=T1HCM2_RHOPR